MAPATAHTLLSPAELSYLHTSLSLNPPIRPDGRSPTTFRPLIAEIDILPSTNGSARICFADGTEAIVGVKAEVKKTSKNQLEVEGQSSEPPSHRNSNEAKESDARTGQNRKGDKSWVEMSIEIPGFRDDDPLPVFLASLLNEAIHARQELVDKLYINERFHWKLYIDVLLLSPPLSYPVPLLSLTIHLALLATALPALLSTGEEDPLFNDDWEAATPLYPAESSTLPPITLLLVAIGDNIIFDPAKEELAVADAVLAISLAQSGEEDNDSPSMNILGMRTVDTPARMTTPGTLSSEKADAIDSDDKMQKPLTNDSSEGGVWTPPNGGIKRSLISRAVSMCLGKGGVANEVLSGLQNFRLGAAKGQP